MAIIQYGSLWTKVWNLLELDDRDVGLFDGSEVGHVRLEAEQVEERLEELLPVKQKLRR